MNTKKPIKEQILEVINDYKNLQPDTSSINFISQLRKDLATLNIYFSVECAKKRRLYKEKLYNYERDRSVRTVENYTNMNNLSKAEIYAKRGSTDLKKVSIKAENDWQDYEYLLKPINEVLNEMSQHIARLRDEKKENDFYNKDT